MKNAILYIMTINYFALAGNDPGRIILDFDNTDIRIILNYIRDQSGMNIVYGKDVSGTITARIQTTDWRIALEETIKIAGLSYRVLSKVLYVDQPDNLNEEIIGNQYFHTHKITTGNLALISSMVKPMLTSRGKMFADERTGLLVVYDDSSTQSKVKSLVDTLNRKNRQLAIVVKVVLISNELQEAIEKKLWTASPI